MKNSAAIIEQSAPYVVYNTDGRAVELNEKTSDKEELYRRLTRSRRILAQALDEVTKDRISGLVGELEQQIAEAGARPGRPRVASDVQSLSMAKSQAANRAPFCFLAWNDACERSLEA